MICIIAHAIWLGYTQVRGDKMWTVLFLCMNRCLDKAAIAEADPATAVTVTVPTTAPAPAAAVAAAGAASEGRDKQWRDARRNGRAEAGAARYGRGEQQWARRATCTASNEASWLPAASSRRHGQERVEAAMQCVLDSC